MKSFPEKIKEARSALSMSQETLAEKVGASRRSIIAYEKGDKHPRDRMLYQLTDQGFPAFILKENDLYKVQVGAYLQLGNAVNMEQRLRDHGYSTVIVTR